MWGGLCIDCGQDVYATAAGSDKRRRPTPPPPPLPPMQSYCVANTTFHGATPAAAQRLRPALPPLLIEAAAVVAVMPLAAAVTAGRDLVIDDAIHVANVTGSTTMLVRPRPGLRSFLTWAARRFTLHLWAPTTPWLLDVLDNDGRLFGGRLVAVTASWHGVTLGASQGDIVLGTASLFHDDADLNTCMQRLAQLGPGVRGRSPGTLQV